MLLPTASHCKWIISVKTKEVFRRSFDFYQPTRWTGHLLKQVLRRSYYLQKILAPRYTLQGDFDFLADAFFSISLGTKGPEQKPTIVHFNTQGCIEAYSKMGHNPKTCALVENEYKTLLFLEDKKTTFSIPRILSYQKKGGYIILKQSTEADLKPIPPKLTPELAAIAHEIKNILPSGDYNHGDFAPWNIKQAGDGHYFVFDWEYAGCDSSKDDIVDMENKIKTLVLRQA